MVIGLGNDLKKKREWWLVDEMCPCEKVMVFECQVFVENIIFC